MGLHSPAEYMWAVRDARGVTATEKLILFVLASHVDRRGDAWPPLERLAAETGRAVPTCQRTLTSLHAKGLIAPMGSRDGGRGMATVWHLRFSRIEASANTESDNDLADVVDNLWIKGSQK